MSAASLADSAFDELHADDVRHHATLWPKVCKAQGFDVKDTHKRHMHTLMCLCEIDPELVKEDKHISSADLNPAQITALFCFLYTLSEPTNAKFHGDWERCRQNYIAYHKSKIADHWQTKAYGKNSNRLTTNRFGGFRKATGSKKTDAALDDKEASDRLMTTRERARTKEKKAREKSGPRKYHLYET